MTYLLGKLFLAGLFTGCSVTVALLRERIAGLAAQLPALGVLCGLFLLGRLAGLWILHSALGIKLPSDIPGYFDHAMRIVHGAVPNHDFSTPYGFLFNYLLAAAVYIRPEPFSILVALQAGECLGLYLLLRAVVARTRNAGDGLVLLAAYAVNPILAVNLWLGGQDESMLTLVLGAAAVLVGSRRMGLVMVVPALLFSASKLFSAWILAPFALTRGWRERFGMLGTLGVMFALIRMTGSALFSFNFSRESGAADEIGKMATSGNMWFVVDNMLGIAPPDWLPGSVALAALGAAGCWLWYHSRRSDPLVLVLAGTALLVVVFQVAYRMSAPPYLGPAVAAFLTLGAITGRWHIVPLAIWSGLWCFEESFWYFMHFGAPEGNVLRTAFLAYDLPVTGLSLLVAWFAAKAIRESQTAGHQPGGIPIPPGTMAN